MNRILIIVAVVAVVAVAVWYQLRGTPQTETGHGPSMPPVFVADIPPPKPVVHLTAEQDHARLLKLLHLSSLRPAPATDNTDEALANPYPDLPDPLKLADGKPVLTTDDWWQKRRQEIADTLEDEVYGHAADNANVTWTAATPVPEKVGAAAALRHDVTGLITSSRASIPPIRGVARLTLWLPAAAKAPVPVILLLKGPGQPDAPPSTWREQVLAKGWGAAVLDVTTIQPDSGAELTTAGVIGIAGGGQPRALRDWGVLRAWSWGASRVMEWLETIPAVDSAHVAIAGHSRYGKAALLAMAYDPRFVVAYISSSGAGGAALLRRHFGEQIENLAGTGEYHWFGGAFLKYAGTLTLKDLPVDAHDLFALAAPRPIFVSAGSKGDDWVDPRGMFMAEAAATPVYKLLGKTGLASTTMPPAGTANDAGELAFRQHAEGHTMEPNWPYFLKFAARYLQPKK
jgi:hypothetical protein